MSSEPLYKARAEFNMRLMTAIQIFDAMKAFDDLQLINNTFPALGGGFLSWKRGDGERYRTSMTYGDSEDVIKIEIPGVDPSGLDVTLKHVHQHYYRITVTGSDGSVLKAVPTTIPAGVYDLSGTDYVYQHGVLYVNLKRLQRREPPVTEWKLSERKL